MPSLGITSACGRCACLVTSCKPRALSRETTVVAKYQHGGKLTATLRYVTPGKLATASTKATTRVLFRVDHPAFDLAAARKRAKITAREYGCDRQSQRWILVDSKRTVAVGPTGELETLPGNWLSLLLALDGSAPVTVSLNRPQLHPPTAVDAMVSRLPSSWTTHSPVVFTR